MRIDTNTAETFRHGVWYAKGDVKQRLDIVPLTLVKFQKYFVSMFEANEASPEKLKELILKCEIKRDFLEAPAWKQEIDVVVEEKSKNILSGTKTLPEDSLPLVPPGAIVNHTGWGTGQVVAAVVNFPEHPTKTVELPYLKSLPDEVSFDVNERILHHDRFGDGTVFAFVVVFTNHIMHLTYPNAFTDHLMTIE